MSYHVIPNPIIVIPLSYQIYKSYHYLNIFIIHIPNSSCHTKFIIYMPYHNILMILLSIPNLSLSIPNHIISYIFIIVIPCHTMSYQNNQIIPCHTIYLSLSYHIFTNVIPNHTPIICHTIVIPNLQMSYTIWILFRMFQTIWILFRMFMLNMYSQIKRSIFYLKKKSEI
eukprot:351199_1